MKTRQWILVLVMAILASPLAAQTRNIFGKVTAKDDGSPLPGVNVILKRSTKATVTDAQGNYTLTIPAREGILVFSFVGMKSLEVNIGSSNRIDAQMEADLTQLNEVVVVGYGAQERESVSRAESKRVGKSKGNRTADYILQAPAAYYQPQPEYNTEEYDGINENIFHGALQNPLSTFSIDVDAASYSNIRRFIQLGQRPPKDAVRIEEMVNYFDYDYKQPTGEDPFSIYTEIAAAPWNKKHKLVHIGLQGKNIPKENLPASNLVFLIDVSGSMSDENKLPLLKASFKLLVEQLREQDRVAIVVYAGAAGLVLPSTSGAEKKKIIESLENLQAGGSTAGGEGIKLAYKIAKENFRKDGNNRVILATDGDFNVGESSNAAMERLVEEKRNDGIFLTTLGFGMGNYKDSKMEILADKGNGNYMYIDSILEAQKALVNEFGGTLFTIAKDVK
ncbi:MAG: von Willebrand factor type A domain-containing protein, partial [Bacteroidota bacterium]